MENVKNNETLVSVAIQYDRGDISREELKNKFRDIEFSPENFVPEGIEVEGEWDNSLSGLAEAFDDYLISEATVDDIEVVLAELLEEGKNVKPGYALKGVPHLNQRRSLM